MTGEIRNPAKLPADLNPAEKEFVRCLAAGESCTIGDGKLPKKAIESGEGTNVVRGVVIRFFAYGGNEENPVSGPTIYLLGAWISGELDLINVNIPYVLRFDNCHFVISVSMLHAKCAALYLSGSCLAQGLFADGLTTKGNMHLWGGCSANNEIRLLNANIGGNLNCSGGKFHNPGKYALNADGLTTKGHVNLSRGFSAEGEVRLVGANIGRNLDCTGGKFHNPNKWALNVEAGNISSGLFWWKTTCKGIVNLAYASADVLTDASDAWESCKVILDGFTYDRFVNPMDAQFRIDWLAKRPDGIGFSPLPYEQAAKVLFGMGRASDAREILLKKERLQTKDGKMPWLQRVGRRLWNVFAGYGYRLRYTLGWMAFCIYVGTSVFLDADLQRRIVPHQPVVLANSTYQSAVRGGAHPTEFVPTMFSGYPKFNQFWFSVDIFIPLFNLHQETHWHPARDERGGFLWLTLWYWFQIVAGWILTSLFLLSVTGLLRPRQSSGAKD